MASQTYNMASNLKNMPLFIPRVFPNHASLEYFQNVFHTRNYGRVERVDFIEKIHHENGKTFFEAFVHFHHWYPTYEALAIQKDIVTIGTMAKLYHEYPSYWILNECLNPETPREREMKQTIQQLEDVAEYEEYLAKDHAEKQEILIKSLFDLLNLQQIELTELRAKHSVDESHYVPIETENKIEEEFDPLLNTPEEESELPVLAMEFSRTHPTNYMRDFYAEVGDALPSEWLQKTETEKHQELEAQLSEVANSTAAMVLSPSSEASYTSPIVYSQHSWKDRNESSASDENENESDYVEDDYYNQWQDDYNLYDATDFGYPTHVHPTYNRYVVETETDSASISSYGENYYDDRE